MIDYLHGVELTPLRRLLFLGALAGGKEVEDTASGNPLTFLTDLARPLKSCLASWQPHQSGSGDPSPENVRPVLGLDGVTLWHTGKNMFDGQFPNIVSAPLYYRPIYVGDDKVTVSSNVVKTTISSYSNLFALAGNVSTGAATGLNDVRDGVSRTITPVDGYITLAYRNFEDVDPRDYNTQIELGETATAYSPYSGTSYSVAFPATGKNLCNGTAYSVGISRDIPQIASSTPVTSPFTTILNYAGVGFVARVNAGVTYALSSDVTGANTLFYCGLYASLEDATDRSKILQYGTTQSTFTPNNDGYLVFMRYVASSGTEVTWSYAQCEKGSSPTAYEPYTATVYGGSLDLTTGVLTAEWRTLTFTENTYFNKGLYDTSRGLIGAQMNAAPDTTADINRDGIFCDNLIQRTSQNEKYSYVKAASGNQMYLQIFTAYIADEPEVTSEEEAKAFTLSWLAENPVTFCYRLSTPKTYQLTPQQITALIGNNTMWADADDLSVTYLKKG